VAGPLYPDNIAWPANVERLEHVAPADHPAFYAASRFTLNVTRADMIRAGFSPSVRLFEAGACATPVISDRWDGIDTLFRPGEEILLATGTEEVLEMLLSCPEPRRLAIAAAAQRRVLAAHTAGHRAAELDRHLRAAMARRTAMRRRPAAALQGQRTGERVAP
jgi:spore maturation protein CgeB